MGNRRIPDLIGQRIGRLGIIDQFHIFNQKFRKNILWFTCVCECGIIKDYSSNNIIHGTTISCGCYNRTRMTLNNTAFKLPLGESSFNTLYKWYRDNANKRNLEFSLNKDEFRYLTQQSCIECGIQPSQICHPKSGTSYASNGSYIYNGIDRRDNLIGYILENCVPCCGDCNQAKLNMTMEQWSNWKSRLIKHSLGFLK